MDRRLVDHLINSDVISRAAMQRLILRASKDKTGIVEQLLADGKTDQGVVARELAAYFEMELVEGDSFRVDKVALKFLPKDMADEHGVLPFAINEAADHVTIAVYDPESASSVIDTLKTATGNEPTVRVAPKEWLRGAIRHFYFDEPWADAPAAVEEVAPDVGEEIELLDDDLVEEKPEPAKPQPSRKGRGKKPEPDPSVRAKPDGRTEGSMEAALEEFDAFLNNNSGWGSSGAPDIPSEEIVNHGGAQIPGWDEDAPYVGNDASGWGAEAGGFSLFDEKSEAAPGFAAKLEEQSALIEKLRKELGQQRAIITALVDELAASGALSKANIKKRMKKR